MTSERELLSAAEIRALAVLHGDEGLGPDDYAKVKRSDWRRILSTLRAAPLPPVGDGESWPRLPEWNGLTNDQRSAIVKVGGYHSEFDGGQVALDLYNAIRVAVVVPMPPIVAILETDPLREALEGLRPLSEKAKCGPWIEVDLAGAKIKCPALTIAHNPWWCEAGPDDQAFVRAAVNLVRRALALPYSSLAPVAESVREPAGDLAGKLTCLAGIAQDAPDGWTRLNPDARALIRNAGAELRRLTDALSRPSGGA